MSSAYLMLIPQLALLLVHLAGLVVAILLLVRPDQCASQMDSGVGQGAVGLESQRLEGSDAQVPAGRS